MFGHAPGLGPIPASYLQKSPPVCKDDAACGMTVSVKQTKTVAGDALFSSPLQPDGQDSSECMSELCSTSLMANSLIRIKVRTSELPSPHNDRHSKKKEGTVGGELALTRFVLSLNCVGEVFFCAVGCSIQIEAGARVD